MKCIERVKANIHKEIDTFDICGITTDGWTSRQCMGYLSLTIHYVSRAYKLITRTLAIQNVTGSMSGEAIKNKILQLLKEWKIENKADCITTDNGNFTLALKYY